MSSQGTILAMTVETSKPKHDFSLFFFKVVVVGMHADSQIPFAFTELGENGSPTHRGRPFTAKS
jgi:hypothetical protein